MSNVFFTSDMHFGHKLVSHLRGFGDTKETADTQAHDDELIKRWHSVVGPDDQVWVLGDLTCSNGQIERALGIMQRLPGTKHFIAGNHDPVHSLHRDAHKWQRKYLEAFESVQTFAKRKVAGKDVLLSHFPYTFDHTNDARYTQWRLINEGAFLLHGHTHSEFKVTSKTELHVGADAWDMTPVPLSYIEDFVTGKVI